MNSSTWLGHMEDPLLYSFPLMNDQKSLLWSCINQSLLWFAVLLERPDFHCTSVRFLSSPCALSEGISPSNNYLHCNYLQRNEACPLLPQRPILDQYFALCNPHSVRMSIPGCHCQPWHMDPPSYPNQGHLSQAILPFCCPGFGPHMQSLIMASVGQYAISIFPFSCWSVRKKYPIFRCLVLLLLHFLLFCCSEMALLLSWYRMLQSIQMR